MWRFFYTGPDRFFPFIDGRFVPLNSATFRLLVAPTYLVEEFAHVITMVFYTQMTFYQIGNALCGPQLGPVAVCHGSLSQETNQTFFLFRCQFWRSTGNRLGLQRFFTLQKAQSQPEDCGPRRLVSAEILLSFRVCPATLLHRGLFLCHHPAQDIFLRVFQPP